MIKGVIFDLDNTLVDFNRIKIAAVQSGISGMIEAGMDIDPQDSYNRIMRIYEDMGWEYQLVFDQFISETAGYLDYKFLAAGILGYRRAREATLTPYAHVNTTLVSLIKMGIKLAVVSDAPAKEAWLRLCQLNFHHLFDTVITFDDSRERKPHPKPFLMALQKLDLAAEETLMIGDWPERDMAGAKNLNITTVFARYGDFLNTQHSGADHEISDFHQILKIITELNSREEGSAL